MRKVHGLDLLFAGLLGLLALLAYLPTLTPSLSYLSPDGSELATVPYILGLAHPPGYPLYTWLGFLFSHLVPFRDVAWRMNLFSALGAAWSAGLAYLIARLLLPPARTPGELRLQRGLALGVGLALAFSPTLWSQALIAEVYAPNLAAVTTTLLLLLWWARHPTPWRYALFALAFGLSLGTHLSNLGFGLGFALFTALVLWQRRAPIMDWTLTILAGGVAFALGAAQYLWLPLRAATLPTGLILGRAPTDLPGLYAYTLGAFSNLRFAFPLTALPDRMVLYLYYLRQQFGLWGILLGSLGLLTMPLVRPRRFLLLMSMYLVHLVFFLEYRAFDLAVFFIPTHAIWAWWIAYGGYGIWLFLREAFTALGQRLAPGVLPRAGTLGMALALGAVLLPGVLALPRHAAAVDLSDDTAINDFYAAVWQVLPEGSTLLSPGGVFGYDVFYWRLVYGTRPDVHLPALEDPRGGTLPATAEGLYATSHALTRRGPGRSNALAPNTADLWAVPVVLGEQPAGRTGPRGAALALLRLQRTPPAWKVTALPADLSGQRTRLGSVTFLGATFAESTVESGAPLHLTLYWRVDDPQHLIANPPSLTLRLDQRDLATFTLGFGLLQPYAQTVGLQAGDLLAFDFWVVVPSTAAAGPTQVTLQTQAGAVLSLGQVEVVDNLSPWAYWLRAAR